MSNNIITDHNKLMRLLTVCREQFGGDVVHGEDCESYDDELEENSFDLPCSCGARTFYAALADCGGIK